MHSCGTSSGPVPTVKMFNHGTCNNAFWWRKLLDLVLVSMLVTIIPSIVISVVASVVFTLLLSSDVEENPGHEGN